MTRKELRVKLEQGETLATLFALIAGQECVIFKAEKFAAGEQIIYIPDLWLNEIPVNRPARGMTEIQDILDSCYTGNDFINLCMERYGTADKAEALFNYVDWQHPSSALDSGELDEEEA